MSERYNKLKDVIKEADEVYYNSPDEATLPDETYDALYDELLDIESQNPEIVKSDSPTQKLVKPAELYDKVRHPRPMLSLAKITTATEIEKFTAQVGIGEALEVSAKLDGMALALYYDAKGNLVQAVSRGDGEIGEDLTQNVKGVSGIPLKIPSGECSIRGEIVIPTEKFELIKDEFVNARNAASGAMRSKDPKDAERRHLSFYAYDLVYDGKVSSAMEANSMLSTLGFFTPVYTLTKGAIQTAEAVSSLFERKNSLPYATDGVVIKVNEYKVREKLGARGKSPRWAVAYKEASETATTTLEDITWQVGKTGVIAPVAILKPVFVEGATVSRATLHNLKYIEDLSLSVGAEVRVTRANSVIPRVLGLEDISTATGISVLPPTECPSCSGEVTVTTASKIVKCANYSCGEQIKGRLESWASRKSANIDSIGEIWVDVMVDAGILNRPSDFYKLTKRHLFQFDGMGEALAAKFIQSIEESKGVGLRKALAGLCIPFVSEGTSKRLTWRYEDIQQVMSATYDELVQIEDVGHETANSIVTYFSDQQNIDEIGNLLQLGVNLNRLPDDALAEVDVESPFAGKKVVITGTLSAPRGDFQKLLESLGAKVSGSVSKTCDILLVGDKAGSKLKKAEELGIQVMTEQDLLAVLKNEEN